MANNNYNKKKKRVNLLTKSSKFNIFLKRIFTFLEDNDAL